MAEYFQDPHFIARIVPAYFVLLFEGLTLHRAVQIGEKN